MTTLNLVTGNKGKLAEWRRLVPDEIQLESFDIDLEEIQSADLEEIVTDKVKRAYESLQKPVVVEDIAAGLVRLGGLPGPFIKFFEKQMGRDALHQLSKSSEEPAIVLAAVAYFDGENLVIARSEVRGTVVAPRGENGFGFDSCFVPDGQSKTYGEMTPAEKDAVSHRAKAVKLLLDKLSAL